MHPLMVLAAFTVAALVVYAVVLGVLSATSSDPCDAEESRPPDRRPCVHC
jgi:hypothetical protein